MYITCRSIHWYYLYVDKVGDFYVDTVSQQREV